MSHLLKKHHFHFCTTGKNKSMMLNQKYLQESVSWVDLGCWPSPTIPRVSSNPRCSNTPRITGMAPTSGVTESLRIQGHRNSCLARCIPNIWSNSVPKDPGTQAFLPWQWHGSLLVWNYSWIRPGVLPLYPLLKHPEGAQLSGIWNAQDHRITEEARLPGDQTHPGTLEFWQKSTAEGTTSFPTTCVSGTPTRTRETKSSSRPEAQVPCSMQLCLEKT